MNRNGVRNRRGNSGRRGFLLAGRRPFTHQSCDRLGLTGALTEASPRPEGALRHVDGEVLRDLILTLMQGGEHLSDLAALCDQPGLFGDVASDATAFRAIERIGPEELEGIRAAR